MAGDNANDLELRSAAVSAKSASHPGRASALREVDALSDLDHVTVGIADVAASLDRTLLRLRDQRGSSTFP
jgi:hypothetical protein